MTCSGVIAASELGVAKDANLIAVKAISEDGCVGNLIMCHCYIISQSYSTGYESDV
jgi:hypothetical protein